MPKVKLQLLYKVVGVFNQTLPIYACSFGAGETNTISVLNLGYLGKLYWLWVGGVEQLLYQATYTEPW